jgi:hypothetical protein
MIDNTCIKIKIGIINIPIIIVTMMGFLYSQVLDTLWTKTYGGMNDDRGYTVKQTTDGGFIIAGETNSFGADHGYLIKTDAYGNSIWTRTYSGAINSILQTYDGGYIFTGTIGHICIVRTDSVGDTLWTRIIIPSNHSSRAEEIQPTSDSCYIVVGTATDYIANEYFNEVYLLKIDDYGDTLWSKRYGQMSAYGYSVLQTYDSGYIVAGRWPFYGCLMKTDPFGDSLWLKLLYPGAILYSLLETSDQGFLITGCVDYYFDVYIIKTDSLGDTIWTRRFGESATNDVAYCIRETSDGTYIVTGYTASYGAGSNDLYLIKMRDSGDTLWTKTYGNIESDIGYEIEITSDSGYIIVGCTESYGNGGYDIWLVKIAPDTFGVEEVKPKVITGASAGAAIITGPLILPETANCRVFDITGRITVPQRIKPGIYFIEVDGKITRKVIKIK